MPKRLSIPLAALAASVLFVSPLWSPPAEAQRAQFMRNSVTSTARMIRQQVRQALKPTLKVRRGAIDRVAGMTATPDTRYLTSSLSDRSLRVWDFKLGTQAATVQAPAGDLTAVALTDGGEYLLALSNSNAYVTDLTDDGLYPVPLNGVSTLAALGNERAVFGTESGEIVLWSLVEGKSVATLNLGLGPLQTLSVQADRVLAGARGGFAQVVVVPNGMYKRRAWPRAVASIARPNPSARAVPSFSTPMAACTASTWIAVRWPGTSRVTDTWPR